ncbi:hydrogenase formation protein HypD [Anaerocolumna sp. AGMB13025]|uniref:hydrogenase formation protein HypD n=1 Tax=Anaerocolumna sp. AGMB13025 TaxID=3039116 RepID=UPI00241E5F9D|nr:hydrogenase formation protein HypD [Anaerocolumna sp. AGMB13025]WFR58108.1 hydrogenase formation protein HypD [Anaerocolumna sp. AGMB13025]
MKTLEQVKTELKNYTGKKIKIMEVCGTHTSSIFKNGIRSLLSPDIQLISGPGCPVCVTASAYIDKLVEYALKENTCVLTFGDMMKVKGNQYSLTEAKALGGNVKILYSPLSAMKLAKEDTHTEYIFAAVGFETTTPIYALMLEEIITNHITNLKFLTSLKTILPALSFVCENEKEIDAFLCPGHVSVITGCSIYEELAQKYQKPFVVAGFEGEHIVAAVDEILHQLKKKQYSMKNMYTSSVTELGNQKAAAITDQYFETADDYWRGIGIIKSSGLKLRWEYQQYDAGSRITDYTEQVPKGCRCQDVILGRIQPVDCPLFQTVCSPLNAVGPCMVSTEGACGIWYKNRRVTV